MEVQVSVVVPTYRRAGLLSRCLQALMCQDLDPLTYEIVVVDDAADAETRRTVQAWADQAEMYAFLYGREAGLSRNHAGAAFQFQVSEQQVQLQGAPVQVPGLPRLRYIPVPCHRGPAAARNLGWRAAAGEIIAFTDDDCLPAPDWLRCGLSAFRDGVAGVSGRVIVPLSADPTDYEMDAAGLARSEFVTANCFYRRRALEAVGGFDERFSLAWREDSDLYFRLLKTGARLERSEHAVVTHPVRPAPWGASLGQQRRSLFNALLYRKHPRLYRQKIQPAPPWRYYGSVLSLLAVLAALAASSPALGLAGAASWSGLTLGFCLQRLRLTSHAPAHVLEMLVTSILIPPISVFWRLAGAVKYRVLFL